jgi:N-acetylmuramoyl-L-alanine amidase
VVAGLWGGVGGCDRQEADPPAPAPPTDPVPAEWPAPEEAHGLRLEVLREAVESAREQAAAETDAERGVALALRGAGLARVLALRESDGEALSIARQLLRGAARHGRTPGTCQAALELARLEARDAVDLEAAYLQAHRTTRRFAGVEGCEPCVGAARRMLRVLDAHRPDPSVLAAAVAEGVGDGPDAVETWARDRVEPGDPAPVLEAIAVYGEGHGDEHRGADRVRVVLRFDRVATFTRGEVAAAGESPRRLYLDFDGATLDEGVRARTEVGKAGLQRIRTGRSNDRLRVVFDLVDDAEGHLFLLSDPYRVVLDFEHEPSTRARRPAPAPERSRTVLLDPGHGGDDFGARFDGLKESHLALDITRRAARLVASRRPDTRVLMTRHGDDFVSLEQRTAMANAADADLFVSVHLNAADEQVRRGGIAAFVLDVSNDDQVLRLAARENGTTPEQVTQLQRVLADLHRQDQSKGSRRLARQVHDALLARARQVVPGLPSRGVREAMFYVLVGARMPAVLVEASFLTHPREAEMLRTDRYRQALADGIAEGILRYLDTP